MQLTCQRNQEPERALYNLRIFLNKNELQSQKEVVPEVIILDESSRNCVKCQTPIEECMGFVKAGDVLELLLGGTRLRELCGRCILVWRWTKDGNLTRRETT
jgi:hypothetical protein